MGIYILFSIVLIIVALLLLTIILIQNPKGGGLLQNFGEQGSQMFGVQRTRDFFEKTTWMLAAILFILIFMFNYLLKS